MELPKRHAGLLIKQIPFINPREIATKLDSRGDIQGKWLGVNRIEFGKVQ